MAGAATGTLDWSGIRTALGDASGGRVIHSGACCRVALFELADGSVKAIGVGTVGISPGIQAFDYGP